MNTENTQNNQPTVTIEQHGKAGRPTKYEPETIERLCTRLADGLPIKSACIVAGISVSTLADWHEDLVRDEGPRIALPFLNAD